MIRRLKAPSPSELRKYFVYALILLAPGSFVVLPVLWLVRQFCIQASLGGLGRPVPPVIEVAREAAARKESAGSQAARVWR